MIHKWDGGLFQYTIIYHETYFLEAAMRKVYYKKLYGDKNPL